MRAFIAGGASVAGFDSRTTEHPRAHALVCSFVGRRRRDVRGAFVPGKLQAYLDAQYAPLSDVVQACVVRHSDQLVSESNSSMIHEHADHFLTRVCRLVCFRAQQGK